MLKFADKFADKFKDKFTDAIQSFFSPVYEEDEDEVFELPLDESGKLIRPMGTVRRVEHRFRTVNNNSVISPDRLELDDEARALLEIAKAVRDKAYCRYSGFAVGAALVAGSGQVYLGVNMENASYPAGLCAERAAFASAVSAGEREFTAIAIVGGNEEEPCFPCGICRQVLAEFCAPDFPVILSDGIYPLQGLLPHAFQL